MEGVEKAIGKENNKKNFTHSFNIENKTVSDLKLQIHSIVLFANIGYEVWGGSRGGPGVQGPPWSSERGSWTPLPK